MSSYLTQSNEEWRWVVGYEGSYQVSNLGRVRSVARTAVRVANGRTTFQPIRDRMLKINTLKIGYVSVALHKDGQLTKYIHRLIWEAFKGPIPEGFEINHKDGIKSNSVLDNLELMTHRENMLHAVRIGIWDPSRKKKKVG